MDLNDLLDTERDFKKIINGRVSTRIQQSSNISKNLINQMFQDLEKDELNRIVKVKFK